MPQDMQDTAPPRALWVTAPGEARLLPAETGTGAPLRMHYSAISRGTERLVLAGDVPPSEYERMRAPYQEGAFPFPVKYGYSAVAERMTGPDAGAMVFALFPHQDRFHLPSESVLPLPPQTPAERAVLGANMETALNVVWDSGVSAGDRVAVMGAGVVGALVSYLVAAMPGTEVTLCDIDPARGALAARLGCDFAGPDGLSGTYDAIVNASASGTALAQALDHAGAGATVVEASWHGAAPVSLPLGGRFHSQRLRIVSSQVGALPPERLPRWGYRRRLAKALDLLADPRLDVLISGESAFAELPRDYATILADPATLCHRIRYT